MDAATAAAEVYVVAATATVGLGIAEQALPDPALAKDLGVIPYLLIVCVGAGVATMCWMLKRFVEASLENQKTLSAAVQAMVPEVRAQSGVLQRLEKLGEQRLESAAEQLDALRRLKPPGQY